MTRDLPRGWRRIPAGKRLDRLVAARVLGWEFLRVGYEPCDPPVPGVRDDPAYNARQAALKGWMEEVDLDAVGDYFIHVKRKFWLRDAKFRPSSVAAHAIRVIEAMRRRGRSLYLEVSPTVASAAFGQAPASRVTGRRSMELAICRAALAAVEQPSG